MATNFFFNGRRVKLPGVYSTIKSGIKNIPAEASYGNILIIDNGSGATFGGGSGIDGALSKNQDSVYVFDNITDFQSFTKGGVWWKLAEPLFRPALGQQGVSRIYFVKAATTTAAEATFAPTGGGSAGGTFVFQVRDEGIIGNGVENTSVLTKGYAFTFQAGEVDTTKFMLKFWVGSYRGASADTLPYNDIPQAQTKPELVCKSVEFSNIDDLFAWANSDPTFNVYFKVKTATKTGTGAVTSADLTTYPGNTLAAGGTETYSSANLDLVLDSVKNLDYSYILSDQYGDNAQGSLNGKMLAHIVNEAKFEKYLVIGGGKDSSKWTQTNGSIPTAKYYNSDRVIVCHGGVKKSTTLTGTGFREYDSLYKAAVVLGRIAGLPPQVPITFKNVDIDGEVHNLTDKEKEVGLDAGVLMTYYDDNFQAFTILQGVNTIQRNTNLVNTDATTYSIQLTRIRAQLNKEIIINGKLELLSQPYGVNRNTLSPEYVRDWTIGYLKSRVANDQLDNLIISFQNVNTVRNQDAYFTTYEFVPNGEITKLFFTGIMID